MTTIELKGTRHILGILNEKIKRLCNSQMEIQIYLNHDLTKILNHITLYDSV